MRNIVLGLGAIGALMAMADAPRLGRSVAAEAAVAGYPAGSVVYIDDPVIPNHGGTAMSLGEPTLDKYFNETMKRVVQEGGTVQVTHMKHPGSIKYCRRRLYNRQLIKAIQSGRI